MTKTILNSVIELNACAVDHLSQGRIEDGIQTLTCALSLLQTNCCVANTPASSGLGHGALGGRLAIPSFTGDFFETTRKCATTPTNSLKQLFPCYFSVPINCASSGSHEAQPCLLSDNIFTFYPRAFQIIPERLTCDRSGLPKLYLVLLYNLAVTVHIKASAYLDLHAGRLNPHKVLSSVVQQYENVLVAAWASLRPDEDVQEMLCLLLATTNNAGHAYSDLMEFPKTRESMSLTIDLLALSKDDQYPIPQEDLHLFFSSTCIFLESRGDLSIAPAA